MSSGLQVTDDFNDKSDVAITYDGDKIDTIVLTKFVPNQGLKTKTYTFTYIGDNIETVTVEILNVEPAP